MRDEFESCVPICDKFHPLTLNKFFFPSPLKFSGYAIAINHKIEIYMEHY